LLSAACLVAALAPREAAAAMPVCEDFQDRKFMDSDAELPYRLYVPPGYAAANTYPLVLVLHGAGERGGDNCNQFSQPGPVTFVSDEAEAKYHAFMVFPQCPYDLQWVDTPWGDGSYVLENVPISKEMTLVLKTLAAVRAEFSIDPKRLYVTGISMGGFGTWDIIMRNPNMFAAAVPMSGGGSPTSAALIKDLPIWDFHGQFDDVVPTQASREMVSALKALGSPVIYTEYPDGHTAWTEQYATAGLVDWLFAQTNGSPAVDPGFGGSGGVPPEVEAGATGGEPASGGSDGTGGLAGSDGTGGSAGSAGELGADPDQPGTGHTGALEGCNCRMEGRRSHDAGAWSLLALGMSTAILRRRRPRRLPGSARQD
jgi:MYXO-CTERM domain-containing protein